MTSGTVVSTDKFASVGKVRREPGFQTTDERTSIKHPSGSIFYRVNCKLGAQTWHSNVPEASSGWLYNTGADRVEICHGFSPSGMWRFAFHDLSNTLGDVSDATSHYFPTNPKKLHSPWQASQWDPLKTVPSDASAKAIRLATSSVGPTALFHTTAAEIASRTLPATKMQETQTAQLLNPRLPAG